MCHVYFIYLHRRTTQRKTKSCSRILIFNVHFFQTERVYMKQFSFLFLFEKNTDNFFFIYFFNFLGIRAQQAADQIMNKRFTKKKAVLVIEMYEQAEVAHEHGVLPFIDMVLTMKRHCGMAVKHRHGKCVRSIETKIIGQIMALFGKYLSEGAAREWSTVVDISIKPPSFQHVPLPPPRSPLSKTLKHVIF